MKYIEEDFPIEKLNEMASREAQSKKPIYQIHRWWARRVGSVFRAIMLATFLDKSVNEKKLWENFYSKNDFREKTVLDPFMGGGTTVIEGLRLGCKIVGIDINPVAWFLTKKEAETVEIKELNRAFEELKTAISDRIKGYYKTVCPECYHEADIIYVFWVRKVRCINCDEEVPLFNSFRLASKGDEHTVFCPICREILKDRQSKKEIECPKCSKVFAPLTGYVRRGGFYVCPHCGQKGRILRASRKRKTILKVEMYAIEYYCDYCKRKDYKRTDENDVGLYEKAKEDFEKVKNELLFPRQKIPRGKETKRPLNYNYEFFYQMFNERQLLCLSLLLEEIMRIRDDNIKEFMLLTLSDCTSANNMFCRYNYKPRKLEPLFSTYAFQPQNVPIENNVWGTKFGRGTFKNYFKKTIRAKKFSKNPFERYIKNGKTQKIATNDEVKCLLVDDFAELAHGNLVLKTQTSEDLTFIPPESVDAVITDPPYYDKPGIYSELADFYYVWLRLGLSHKYECFQSEYSPKAREIIKNVAQKKDNVFFIRGLTRVFKECNRVLNDEGLLVFTFHHEKTKAWTSVLKSVLDADFFITAAYPISSESRSGLRRGIKYDVIIVCKKRKETTESISWEKVKDQVYIKARDVLTDFWKSGREISDVDLFVITMGKCLEAYSQFYPNVLKKGSMISVEEAVGDIDDIIDSLIKARDMKILPTTIDEETRLYVSYVAGVEEMSYDELHKRLSKGGGDIDFFISEKFLQKAGNMLEILKPSERRDFIADKIRKGRDLKIIDRIHFLYLLYKERKPLTRFIEQWADDALKKVCELLYKKTGEQTYARIGGIVEITPAKKKIVTTLDEYGGEEN